MSNPIRCAIVGATGYTGLRLIEILLRHPQARLTYLASHREELPDIRNEFPVLRGRLPDAVAKCRPLDYQAMAKEADVVFLALPHRAAFDYAPKFLAAGIRVIDLSADYRLKDPGEYERVYAHAHGDPANLKHAVYGIPELFRADLRGATLVANPGCYPTAAALAIAPLAARSLVKTARIHINAASGVTGAGRKAQQSLHFPETNQSYAAYGEIGGHRHQPEIAQTLTRVVGRPVEPLFVPHLLPVDCGILETIYLEPADAKVTEDDLLAALEDAYRDEPFVRVNESLPNIKHVVGTNFCDLSVRLTAQGDQRTVVVFAAEDNIGKGASGQAVQNMNAVFGLPETMGLL